jgi:hypothetical protein
MISIAWVRLSEMRAEEYSVRCACLSFNAIQQKEDVYKMECGTTG